MKSSTFEINAGYMSGQNKYKRIKEKSKSKSKSDDYYEYQAFYKDSYESYTSDYYDSDGDESDDDY
jgi:hypothetical protein